MEAQGGGVSVGVGGGGARQGRLTPLGFLMTTRLMPSTFLRPSLARAVDHRAEGQLRQVRGWEDETTDRGEP